MYQYRFTFLCSKEEKANLAKLANVYHRSQSDVIRLLLRKAISDLPKNSPAEAKTKKRIQL